MQIINGANSEPLPIIEKPALQLKQGATATLQIKKRAGSQEAVAVINGREVGVQFAGKMPAGEKLTVIIGTMNEKGLLVVHPAANQSVLKTNVTDSLKMMIINAGFPLETNGDLLAAAKLAAANGGTINEEIIRNLQYFLVEEQGTISEKLKTIETMLGKKLELSVTQLHAVHQVLHGKNTAETLTGLIQGLGLKDTIERQTVLPQKEFQAIGQALEGKGDLSSAVEKWLYSIEFIPEKNDGTSQLKNDYSVPVPYTAMESQAPQVWPAKNIIVTEITQKLSRLAADFKKEQRGISENLEQIMQRVDRKQNHAAVKQTLESTIHKLSRLILKSEIMLYADMETEKKLLIASSRLAEAKELSEKGSLAEAKAIVGEIKTAIEKIQFKPANVKMQHFTAELLKQNPLQPQDKDQKQAIKARLEQALKPLQTEQHSARQVFASIKALGLNHERDIAQHLLTPKQEQQDLPVNLQEQPEQQINLKETLIKLLQNEHGQTKPVQEVEQTIAHLTGQQLLNKSEQAGQQQLFLQLPLLLNNKMENIKVYISSDKKGETLDWENCSLYFVLDTKKMGEVGIMVHVQNRQLSLTLKNNEELFQEKMEPLAGETLERLQEIGYNTGTIQYASFSHPAPLKEEQPQVERKERRNINGAPRKGFDFSI